MLDIINNVQHYNKKIIIKCEWRKIVFNGLSSLLLFLAQRAVGGLGDCEGKLAYIRRHTKQQHERRRSEEQQQGGFFGFCYTIPPTTTDKTPPRIEKMFFWFIVLVVVHSLKGG